MDETALKELEDLQHQIDAEGGWNLERRIETLLSEMNLPAERRMKDLSGGWRRRAAIARALVSSRSSYCSTSRRITWT